jgi:protein TonB
MEPSVSSQCYRVETTDYENVSRAGFARFFGVSFLIHMACLTGLAVIEKQVKIAFTLSPPIEIEIHDMEMKKPEPPTPPVRTAPRTNPPPVPQVARVVMPQPVTEQTPPKQETITASVPLQSDSASPDAAPVYAPSAPAVAAPPGPVSDEVASNRVQEFAFGSENGPSFLSRVPVQYPLAARRMGREGRVLLRLTLDERGALTNVEVLENPGYGFADAAVAAVKMSRFSPGRINNREVATRARLPIRFALRERE